MKMNKPKKTRKLSELELEKEKIKLRIKQQEYEIKKNLLDLKSEYHPIALLSTLVNKVKGNNPNPENDPNAPEEPTQGIKHYIQTVQNAIKSVTEKINPNPKNETHHHNKPIPPPNPPENTHSTFTIGKDDNLPSLAPPPPTIQQNETPPPPKMPYIIENNNNNEPPIIL